MRSLVIALALIVTPALAQGWDHYSNKRYGFVVDVPPGFAQSGEAGNGDGLVFAASDAVMTARGGSVLPGSFNDEWETTQASYRAAGWTLTYEPMPPNWTTFTGERDGRELYVKMLPLCGGTKQYAMLSFEYPAANESEFGPLIEQAAASLKRDGTGFGC